MNTPVTGLSHEQREQLAAEVFAMRIPMLLATVVVPGFLGVALLASAALLGVASLVTLVLPLAAAPATLLLTASTVGLFAGRDDPGRLATAVNLQAVGCWLAAVQLIGSMVLAVISVLLPILMFLGW